MITDYELKQRVENARDLDAEKYMDSSEGNYDEDVEYAHNILEELTLLVGKYKDTALSSFRIELQNEGELVLEHAKALNIAINNNNIEEADRHFLALCKIHLG